MRIYKDESDSASRRFCSFDPIDRGRERNREIGPSLNHITRTNVHASLRTRTHACTHTHACMHARTHTQARTHTLAHSLACEWLSTYHEHALQMRANQWTQDGSYLIFSFQIPAARPYLRAMGGVPFFFRMRVMHMFPHKEEEDACA
jgi:hypothetical protein